MRAGVLVCVLCVASLLSGCGGVYAKVSIRAARARLEHARSAGAEKLSPYEYYFASEHLRKAEQEEAEASYSDAAELAETAELYAQKAVEVSERAKRDHDTGSGRDSGTP